MILRYGYNDPMHKRSSRFTTFFLAAALFATAARAAETEEERHERVERLIEQLASPNEPPEIVPKSEDRFPENFDRAAQTKVLAAWKLLLSEGYSAFPELLEYLGDKRYCCTTRGSAADLNLPVGRICEDIMKSQITVFADKIEYLGRWKPFGFEGGLSNWCSSRKAKSLRELQIEATESALKRTREFDVRGVVEDQRLKNIEILTELLADLKSQKEPIRIEKLSRDMLGLPGDTRQPRFGK